METMMMFEILEQIILFFSDQIPDVFAVPAVLAGIWGLIAFNRIKEPVKESTLKLLSVVAMVFGGITALLIVL
jgi:hypothetical protein